MSLYHFIFVFIVPLAFAVLKGLLTTEDNDPELARRMSIKRVLRKNGLLGRRDK